MIDYNDIYEKWVTFLSRSAEERSEVLACLHEETQNGFDLITQVALDDISDKYDIFKDQSEDLKTDIHFTLSLFVYAGYFLYLIEKEINPYEGTLKTRKSTTNLAQEWIAYTDSDTESLIEKTKISPVLMSFLSQMRDDYSNRLLTLYPEFLDFPYKIFAQAEQILFWAAFQGYFLGTLENKRTQ